MASSLRLYKGAAGSQVTSACELEAEGGQLRNGMRF